MGSVNEMRQAYISRKFGIIYPKDDLKADGSLLPLTLRLIDKVKDRTAQLGYNIFIIVHSHKHTDHIQGPLSFHLEEAGYAGRLTLL